MKASKFSAGERVRITLPSSKLHGLIAECVRQVPPLGWWILKADRDLEVSEGEEPTRELMAPDLWLEHAPAKRSRRPSALCGAAYQASNPVQNTRGLSGCSKPKGHAGQHGPRSPKADRRA